MNGYEAAVECKKTGCSAYGDTPHGRGTARCFEGEFRWAGDLTQVCPRDLAANGWRLIAQPHDSEPACPEGYELWPLMYRATDGWALVCALAEAGGGGFKPEVLATLYPKRFRGWRFVDPRHGGYYRLDTWMIYAGADAVSYADEIGETEIATHALMRKEG